MSDVSISYKGAEIAALDASGAKRLLTSGKYCEGDIEVAYTKPGGGPGYSVEAVFNQGSNKIFSTDNLNALKPYLTVTVTYSDSSSEILGDDAYTLTGTLTVGTSTITVTAMHVSTTISVTVTEAEDVTPVLAGAQTYNASVQYNQGTGELTVITSTNSTYSQAYVTGLRLESGYRYRIKAKAKVIDANSTAVITFMNPSTAASIGLTNKLNTDGDLVYDGIPSQSSAYVTPVRLNFYVTWTTSTRGAVVFSDIQIIKYSDATENELLSILTGGESA